MIQYLKISLSDTTDEMLDSDAQKREINGNMWFKIFGEKPSIFEGCEPYSHEEMIVEINKETPT